MSGCPSKDATASWLNLRFTAEAGSVAALSEALAKLGALSVTIDDAAAGSEQEQPIFGEPGMPEDALWKRCLVCALLPGDMDADAVASAAALAAGLAHVPLFAVEKVAQADWVRLTQSQFAPVRVSARLWIVPTWHDVPDPQAINIRLDPGVAFGTGSHPTTRLCLQWLEQNLRGGESVLDYGCGSGILAIAAKKLGAGSVVGVDIDSQAVQAARRNARQNDVSAEFRLAQKNTAFAAQITVANILANPLQLLAPLLAASTLSEGSIVLSGILAGQADGVVAAYAPWFKMAVYKEESGWVCLHGRKLPPSNS